MCILVYLMYDQVGPACFAGVAFIVLLLPAQCKCTLSTLIDGSSFYFFIKI